MLDSLEPGRWSLRFLFVAMSAFAVWCMVVVALPVFVSQLLVGLLWVAAGGWVLAGIVFGTGDARAFCLGAALGLSSMWTGFGGQAMQGFRGLFLGVIPGGRLPGQPISLWFDALGIAGLAVVSGWICRRARRHFDG